MRETNLLLVSERMSNVFQVTSRLIAFTFAVLQATALNCSAASAQDTIVCTESSARHETPKLLTIGADRVLLVDRASAKDLDGLKRTAIAQRATAMLVLDQPAGVPDAGGLHLPVVRLSTAPAEQSQVLSLPSDDTRVASGLLGPIAFHLLVRKSASGGQVLGAIVSDSRGRGTVEINWFPAQAPTPMPDIEGLEHMYRLVMRQSPGYRFVFRGPACFRGSARAGTQADALRRIAVLRSRLIANPLLGRDRSALKHWTLVSLRDFRARPNQLRVSVRSIDDAGRPVAGAWVTFGRGLDLSCRALTDKTGAASCTLADEHGASGAEPDPDRAEAAPTIATFAGLLTPGTVFLPTSAAAFP